MKNILSVDVEDWFHILEVGSSPDLDDWRDQPSRVGENFLRMLDLFDRTGVRVTCFFLGWVAEQRPDLVREASGRGHEVASHGYGHRLIYTQTPAEFAADVSRAKDLLEQIAGNPVTGYRAPGFSIIRETMWAFEELVRAGYRYDSSVFPAPRGHGGIAGAQVAPHRIATPAGELIEFPLSVASLLGFRLCFFGGGYLRLAPLGLIRRMARKVNAEGRPVVYYVHPREIDPGHPRLSMNLKRRFKSYVNLHTTLPKLEAICGEQEIASFGEWLGEHGETLPLP